MGNASLNRCASGILIAKLEPAGLMKSIIELICFFFDGGRATGEMSDDVWDRGEGFGFGGESEACGGSGN